MKIIKDFFQYRKIMNTIDTIEISKSLKLRLSSYNKETEDEISKLINNELVKLSIKEELSRDYVLWFRHALAIRNGLFKDYLTTKMESWQDKISE